MFLISGRNWIVWNLVSVRPYGKFFLYFILSFNNIYIVIQSLLTFMLFKIQSNNSSIIQKNGLYTCFVYILIFHSYFLFKFLFCVSFSFSLLHINGDNSDIAVYFAEHKSLFIWMPVMFLVLKACNPRLVGSPYRHSGAAQLTHHWAVREKSQLCRKP